MEKENQKQNLAMQVLTSREILGKGFKVYGTIENPLFLAKDVAEWIEHTDVSAMIKSIDEDEKVRKFCELEENWFPTKNRKLSESSSYRANRWFLTENGLYEVLMQSTKPIAKQFKKQVKAILKEIRTKGGYIATSEEDTEETILARAVLLAQATIEKKNKQIEQMKDDIYVLEEEIETNAPKVLFADAVSTSQRSCLISELAKILTQNGYEIGQNRLFKKLREQGYPCKSGSSYNQPTQRAMEMGLFEIKQTSITKPDGHVIVNVTPKVTGKGQIYFINKFLNIKTA